VRSKKKGAVTNPRTQNDLEKTGSGKKPNRQEDFLLFKVRKEVEEGRQGLVREEKGPQRLKEEEELSAQANALKT